MNLDDASDALLLNYVRCECNLQERSACGSCATCYRRASITVAGHVRDGRYERRGRSYENSGPEERRYVQRRTLLMLDVLGLAGDAAPDEAEIRLSEWGRSMRDRQL